MTALTILIHSLDGGGAERTAVNIANTLAGLGYGVAVVTQAVNIEDRYTLSEQVDRLKMPLDQVSESVVSGLVSNLKRVWQTRKVLKSTGSSTVLSFMPSQNCIAILACVGLRTHLVIAERSYPGNQDGRLWAFLRRILYRFANVVTVQTTATEKWIKENTKSRNITVIPNFVSLPLPENEPERRVNDFIFPEQTVILAVGRDNPAKGFDLLIESFALLPEKANIKLVLAGVDSKNSYCSQVEKLSLNESVIFPGRIGNLTPWYQRADVFVLPSRREGFPNALLEAMSMGCAVVSFDCLAGPADLIANKVNGLLVPPENVVQMAEAIHSVLTQNELKRLLKVNALNVCNNYAKDAVMHQWISALNLPSIENPRA